MFFCLSNFIIVLLVGHFLFTDANYVKIVNTTNIDSVLHQQPLLIEFYAPWCRHCMAFETTYQQLAEELQNEKFTVGKVNIDDNQALASRFEIKTIPTIFLYRDGKLWKYEGSINKEDLYLFSTKKYKNEKAMPYWTSPIGPAGFFKGVLTKVGLQVSSLPEDVSKMFGVSNTVSTFILVIGFAIAVVFFSFVGILVSLQHQKND